MLNSLSLSHFMQLIHEHKSPFDVEAKVPIFSRTY